MYSMFNNNVIDNNRKRREISFLVYKYCDTYVVCNTTGCMCLLSVLMETLRTNFLEFKRPLKQEMKHVQQPFLWPLTSAWIPSRKVPIRMVNQLYLCCDLWNAWGGDNVAFFSTNPQPDLQTQRTTCNIGVSHDLQPQISISPSESNHNIVWLI